MVLFVGYYNISSKFSPQTIHDTAESVQNAGAAQASTMLSKLHLGGQ